MTHRFASRIATGALVLLAACDVPTGMPSWQETWNLPARSTTISVASLLPMSVTITPDSSAFAVDVPPVSVTRQLGQDCAECAVANGTTVPKPAFTMTASGSSSLPADVSSATLVNDTLTLTIENGLDFDPLRPSATARGYLVLTVTNGSTTLARDSVDGATTGMPAGSSLVRAIPLAGTVSGGAPLQVSATLYSPQGDSVQMNSSEAVTVTASTGNCLVSSARVKVQNLDVSAAPVSLDLSGVGTSVTSRVLGGALDINLTNPFAVQGTVTLYLTGTTSGGQKVNLIKPVAISSAATSTSVVNFTQSEVQQLLGTRLSLQMGGAVSGQSGLVTVTPREAVDVSTRFELVVSTEGHP